MVFSFITFLFLILIIYYGNRHVFQKTFNFDFNIKRYISLSKKYQTDDIIVSCLRIVAILINVFVFILLLAFLERDIELLKNLGLGHLLIYFLIDSILQTYINAKEIKQRIDLLSYLKASFVALINIFIVMCAVFYESKSSFLSQVIQSQNQIEFYYIKWNFVIMFPLFVIFIVILTANIKDLSRIAKISEIDLFHNSLYLISKTIVYITLIVILFLAADTSFAFLDFLNLNSVQLLVINKTIFLIKYYLVAKLISFLLVHKRWESIISRTNTYKRHLYISTAFVLIFFGLKVVNF